jgi:hypothetical protein
MLHYKQNTSGDASCSISSKQLMRNLFGEGKISEDMNFDWVNKDNIHNVYSSLFILLKTIKMPILVKIGTKLN